ncbi:hypothetical protein B484DRAFT_462533, partial [Ochromonadaceae sp. CCMP2298]
SAPASGVSVTAVTAELEVDLDPDEREDADADRSLNDPSDSHFDANYVKTDNVLFRDLNCTDCVLCICDYNMRVVQESVVDGVQLSTVGDDALQSALFGARMTVRADGVLVNQDGVGILPVHQHTGAISIGDGSPSYSIIRGMDEGTIPRVGPGGQEQPALYNSPGGFHMSLEMWKMWGALFRDSHLTTLVKTWRLSQAKLDCFLNPGDPRQTEDETEEYLLANYLSAARACAMQQGEEQVTALQVEEYMRKRACEHAAVFDVWLGLQWANVIFMMRGAEGSGEHGNLELFHKAQRIATLLFALTHATKY